MAKFVVAGIVQIETIVKVEHIPIEYTPVVCQPNTIFTNIGGDAYNESLALKALGNDVDFLSMIGKNDTNRLVCVGDACGSLDTSYVKQVLEETPTAVVLYDNERQQQIYEDIKDIHDAVYDLELFQKCIADADAVVLANANFCRPLARAAKEAGKTLAINFRSFSEDKERHNEDMLRLADIIYLGDDNIIDSSYEFVKKLADTYGTQVVILGQGAKGLIIYSRKDDLIAHYNTVKTNEIVNTVGAGNSLFSCFLHFYISTGDAVHAIKNALLFASYKIGFMGTSNGFLSEDRLEHWYRLIWREDERN